MNFNCDRDQEILEDLEETEEINLNDRRKNLLLNSCFNFTGCCTSSDQVVKTSSPDVTYSLAAKVLRNWDKRAEILGCYKSPFTFFTKKKVSSILAGIPKLQQSAEPVELYKALTIKARTKSSQVIIEESLGYWLIGDAIQETTLCDALYLNVLKVAIDVDTFHKTLLALLVCHSIILKNICSISAFIEPLADVIELQMTASVRKSVADCNIQAMKNSWAELQRFNFIRRAEYSEFSFSLDDYLVYEKSKKVGIITSGDFMLALAQLTATDYAILEFGVMYSNEKECAEALKDNIPVNGEFWTNNYSDPSISTTDVKHIKEVVNSKVSYYLKDNSNLETIMFLFQV